MVDWVLIDFRWCVDRSWFVQEAVVGELGEIEVVLVGVFSEVGSSRVVIVDGLAEVG